MEMRPANLPEQGQIAPQAFDPRPPALIRACILLGKAGEGEEARLVRALGDILTQASAAAATAWPQALRPGAQEPIVTGTSGEEWPPGDLLAVSAMADDDVAATEAIHRALVDGVPVIRLSAGDADGVRLYVAPDDDLRLGLSRSALGDIPATAQDLARLLLEPPIPSERRRLLGFLAEGAPKRAGRFEYDLILSVFGPGSGNIPDAPPDGWQALGEIAGPSNRGWLERLKQAHDYANGHAVAYGEKWRSAIVMRSFVLLLPIVVSGLLGVLAPSLTLITIPLQLAITALLFFDRRRAARGHWREKWIAYRNLSERLRCLRFLLAAGAGDLRPDEGGRRSWVDWYAWRTECALGTVDTGAISSEALLKHLTEVEIRSQVLYHRGAVRRFTSLDKKLRRLARGLLLGAAGLGALAFAYGALRSGISGIPWLALTSLGLTVAPSLVAGINAFRAELDIVRQAERSVRARRELARLARAASARTPSPDLARVVALRAAAIMSHEVTNWRSTLETRAARLKRH